MKIILSCPKCGKEYESSEYNNLKRAKPNQVLIGRVSGKNAPKEVLEEVSHRLQYELGLNNVLHEGHVDIFKEALYDARVRSECKTEFGFAQIVGGCSNGNVIYHIDLDLINPEEDKNCL